jgi:hypothetical protein
MMNLLKNKVFLLAACVLIVLIVVIVAGVMFFPKSSQNQSDQGVSALPTQVPIPTIAASAIGLVMEQGAAGKTAIVTVANTEGIASIDYELNYTAKNLNPGAGSSDRIPRGVIGQLDPTKKPVTKEITLGTCSDVCHYDQEIKGLKIVLKITKTDGKVYQAEASLASVTQ